MMKKMPYISIDDGKLVVDFGEKKPVKAPATKNGAKLVARELRRKVVTGWLYSSTVDFPLEAGGEDLDFRTLIETMFWSKELQEFP
jgi:hypothetical protein